MNTSHSGNVPVTLNDAVGTPVEIARKLLSVPATKVVVAPLIIKGATGRAWGKITLDALVKAGAAAANECSGAIRERTKMAPKAFRDAFMERGRFLVKRRFGSRMFWT